MRFVVIAALLVGLALAAPRVAPTLFAAIVDRGGAEIETPPAAPPMVVVEPPQAAPDDSVDPLDGRRVSVAADPAGHFFVDARMNGRTVRAMIDTGATTVALTEATARRIGIRPGRGDFTQPVATANGIVKAAPVAVAEVRIGTIVVRNVEAVVVPGDSLSIDLLGMSYLGRLAKFESAGGRFVLVK